MCASSPSHLLLNKYCQYGLVHVIEDLNSRNRVSNRTNNSPQHLCRWERSSSLLWCIHSSRIYLIYSIEWNYYAKISDIFLCAEASALMKSIPWIYINSYSPTHDRPGWGDRPWCNRWKDGALRFAWLTLSRYNLGRFSEGSVAVVLVQWCSK